MCGWVCGGSEEAAASVSVLRKTADAKQRLFLVPSKIYDG